MSEWKTYRLGDLCSRIKSGKGIPASEVSTTGEYPVIGGNGIRGYTNTSNFNGVCAVVGRQGAYCGNVRFFSGEAYMTEHAVVIVGNELADTRYLAYLLSIMQLGHLSAQSAQPGLSVQTLSKLSINIPDISTQRRIAGILGSLDDKIELNRRINANLEAQAQALFRSWFVDFEPFRDGPFVDSELGKIPQGWKVAELGDVTKQQTEKVGPQKTVKVLSPITTGELVLSEEYFTKQVFSESIAKYIIVKPDQFAYNPARINIGSIGRNTFEFDGCVSPVYVVFECEKGYHYFFDFFRKTDAFKQKVISRAIGGVRQTLGYKDFALIKVIYPPQNVVQEFNALYINLLNMQNHNKLEITTLSALRDTMLPKLMAGEIAIE